MSNLNKVRIGIIGIGNMGSIHMNYIAAGKIEDAELTAICDIIPERIEHIKANAENKISTFDNVDSLLNSGLVDGVIIATPHYVHPAIAIKSFEKGLHVLVEKPAGVYTRQVREMNEAAAGSKKVFGIMYNQRTNPLYQKLRQLVQSGELGEIKRTNWIISTWYRTQAYYNSGDWRATWAGEGGGVLLNQCPHNLDLWQWICGMPKKVRGFCGFGKYHNIEVEDDVTAYVEYENGATGVFITSTGEFPGTNRLEITGDRGKIVVEDGKLNFFRLCESERKFNEENKKSFSTPEVWKCEVPITGTETSHQGITADWVQAVLKGTPLLAPGEEGINGLLISNAIYLSAWTDNWVNLPFDEDLFYEKLMEKIRNSAIR